MTDPEATEDERPKQGSDEDEPEVVGHWFNSGLGFTKPVKTSLPKPTGPGGIEGESSDDRHNDWIE